MARRTGPRPADRNPAAPAAREPGGDGTPTSQPIDFRRLAEELPAAIFLMSPDGTIRWQNRASDAVAGRTAADLEPNLAIDVHVDDVAPSLAAFTRALAREEPWELRTRIRRPDGEFRWLLTHGTPSRDGDGALVAWLGVATDVDDEHRAHALLEAVFEHAPVGLAFIDTENRFQRINAMLAEINGLPSDAHIGPTVAEVVPALWPQLEPLHDRVLDSGQAVFDQEISGETPASPGEERTWRVSFYPVKDVEKVIGTGVVAWEVTEQLRAERELERLAEQRRELLAAVVRAQERERRRIAADIHGDTLQVFAAVRLQLEQLGETLSDPAQREALERFESALAAAHRRLRGLLFELWPPSLERAGLEAAIEELSTRIESDTGVRISFDARLERDLPLEMRGAVFRITAEALGNIARHARARSAAVELTDSEDELRLRVTDDGAGFDPTTAPQPGHVGLLEMRERVGALGGSCDVTSTPMQGTCVEVRVPLDSL
ncbi:MAG TPA: PAS domain-containing protein [Solirubrobacteraceae bacterium]|nr:PAS domain-containing protein [Solirubrobacteraceae bacterium]